MEHDRAEKLSPCGLLNGTASEPEKVLEQLMFEVVSRCCPICKLTADSRRKVCGHDSRIEKMKGGGGLSTDERGLG